MSINYRNQYEETKPNQDNFDNRDKKERLINIEKKLQAITTLKQNQVKNEIQEQVTKRVLDVQQKLTEQIKSYEWEVRQIREQLCQFKLKEGDMSKKCELFRRQRIGQIKDLHKKIMTLIHYQSNERKQFQSAMILLSQQKLSNLMRQLTIIKEVRKQILNSFQNKLQSSLPELQLLIESSSQNLDQKFETIYNEVSNEVSSLKQKILRQQTERQKGVQNVMLFINEIVLDIKNDMNQERVSREHNHQNLLKLFDSACSKFKLI